MIRGLQSICMLAAVVAGFHIGYRGGSRSSNHTFTVTANGPGTSCARGRQTMCCDELDYSGYEVQCVGPGKVNYFEQCLNYDPLPMCCCASPGQERPNLPTIPTLISCDTGCTVLSIRRQLRKKPEQ